MRRRHRWIYPTVGAVLVVLLGGRWLAVRTTDRLWAEALGVGEAQAAIAELRVALTLIAFIAATGWCLGNLLLVYRSIGSVHVPRRLGNLEFVEALPPRYLLGIVIGLGLALGLFLSHGAGEWWRLRALADAGAAVGLRDPILERDLGFYLFDLPWRRALHGFVTVGAGLTLAVTVVLYAAVGAVRWAKRRLEVTDMARVHLAGLFATFALTLFWGYRLEPVEYVAGIHDVPLDAVLVDVRIPAARLLASLALVVAAASIAWIWVGRTALIATAWSFLAATSFTAHYLVPAFSAAVRPAAELIVPRLEERQAEFTRLAYGLDAANVILDLATLPTLGALAAHRDRLAEAPIWDPFAVTAFLNRAVARDPVQPFRNAWLGVYGDHAGRPASVYLSVREPRLDGADTLGPAPTWEQVHRGRYSTARGLVAVSAHRTSAAGFPLFVPDLARADSTTTAIQSLRVVDSIYRFAPNLEEYAVTQAGNGGVGVPAGGWLRRLALAWVLQSPALLSAAAVGDSGLVTWDRAVERRLERLAPFARFGTAYPAVTEGRLYWLANGYLTTEGFPLAPGIVWEGREIRGMDAGLVGVVDAVTGTAGIYRLAEPHPLSEAWARVLPTVVHPWDSLAVPLKAHVRYPAQLLGVQMAFVREGLVAGPPARRAPVRRPGSGAGGFWWVGGTAADSVDRLRLTAAVSDGDPDRLVALVDGAMHDGVPRLRVIRLTGAAATHGPAAIAAQLAAVRSDTSTMPGQLRLVALGSGVLALRAYYETPEVAEADPRLAEVVVGWGELAARGPTLAEALRRLELLRVPPRAAAGRWVEARQWFERLDAARRTGDWATFGQAYEALRRLLIGPDSLP